MPKALEEKLKRRAAKMHLSKERTGAYVYGNKTMLEYRKHKKGK